MSSIPILIQAAMGSARLPGKSLMQVVGPPLVTLAIQRASRSKLTSDLYVLVPAGEEQQPLIDYLQWLVGKEHLFVGVTEKGHAYQEFTAAVLQLKCQAFVRLTGDNPFVDPALIDLAVKKYQERGWKGIVHTYPAYPPGFDVEVVRRSAFFNAPPPPESEQHVTSALYGHDRWFSILLVPDFPFPPTTSVTVDTQEDLDRVRRIYADIGPYATYKQIVAWFSNQPGEMAGRPISALCPQPSPDTQAGGQSACGVVGALAVVDPRPVSSE